MKFFSKFYLSYVLNTSIELPHEGRVHALQFQPADSQVDGMLAVSTGDDKKFRIWGLASGKFLQFLPIFPFHYFSHHHESPNALKC